MMLICSYTNLFLVVAQSRVICFSKAWHLWHLRMFSWVGIQGLYIVSVLFNDWVVGKYLLNPHASLFSNG
jgi:hypothetical protein